jgi:hypothetical protein
VLLPCPAHPDSLSITHAAAAAGPSFDRPCGELGNDATGVCDPRKIEVVTPHRWIGGRSRASLACGVWGLSFSTVVAAGERRQASLLLCTVLFVTSFAGCFFLYTAYPQERASVI